MSVLWWGRPGARPMPDRGNRNPSPVSAGGRLFVQGDRTLFGIDAYNGTILWFQQIPMMRRTNIPRDGSNMVAAEDLLYLALGDRCVGLDGGTGHQAFAFEVPQPPSDKEQADKEQGNSPYNWGYLAVIGERVLGSAVHRGSHYLGDDGEWFEDFETAATSRVTSKNLFARDRHTGDLLWNYSQGVIINSTITASEGLIWFIESRSPASLQAESSRLFSEVLQEQYLVALEVDTGEIRWEKSIDLSQCQYMTYLCYSEGKLVMTGTDENQKFHTYVYYSTDGNPLWEHHAQAKKVHHSGKLDHPTVVNNRLYLNKHTYDLSSGSIIEVDEFDWHGCGVMSASEHTLFRRFEYHGMYDLHTKKRTEFLGLRTGCWLSLIPSGGLLLAPESSAGCSCQHSIQTSIAYVPKAVRSKASESPYYDEGAND
jgi:outer membrane protein assembly factor BamB